MKLVRPGLGDICSVMDWIPVVSTVSNLVHIFARCFFKIDPRSSYGQFLKQRNILTHLILTGPIINIFYLATRYLYKESKKPEPVPVRHPEPVLVKAGPQPSVIFGKKLTLSKVPEGISHEISHGFREAPKGDYLELLNHDLPKLITGLTSVDLECKEEDLEKRKTDFRKALIELIEKFEDRKEYPGAPEGEKARSHYVGVIKLYLSRLQGYLKANPDEKLDRIQILRAAALCAPGFLAVLEQLHALKCDPLSKLSLPTYMALWLSNEIKRFLESMIPDGCVHRRNLFQWQLRSYIADGILFEKDPFAGLMNEIEKEELMTAFFTKMNALSIGQSLADALKWNEVLQEKLLGCIRYIYKDAFDDIGTDASIRDLWDFIETEVKSIDAKYKRLTELKSSLEGYSLKELYLINRVNKIELLKMQLEKEREHLCDDLFSKKEQAKDLIECLQKIRDITGKKDSVILSSSLEDLKGVDFFIKHERLISILADKFIETHRNQEDGSFSPETLAHILYKMGLLTTVA